MTMVMICPQFPQESHMTCKRKGMNQLQSFISPSSFMLAMCIRFECGIISIPMQYHLVSDAVSSERSLSASEIGLRRQQSGRSEGIAGFNIGSHLSIWHRRRKPIQIQLFHNPEL
jgi:hypothetical protein